MLSLSQIASTYRPEYSGQIALSSFYLGGSNVQSCIQNKDIPKTGTIAFGSFSNPITNAEALFENPGTYTFTVPRNITNLSMICIGGGGGGGCGSTIAGNAYGSGGGGALMYKNNYTVTPGQPLTVTVGSGGTGGTMSSRSGANGGDSTVTTSGGTVICRAKGGTGGDTAAGSGGLYTQGVGDGGGSGGDGLFSATSASSGGGAGGYFGGGSHSFNVGTMVQYYGTPCATGGGSSGSVSLDNSIGGGGGGVGIYGNPSPYGNIMSGIIGYFPFDKNATDVCGNYVLSSTGITYLSSARAYSLTNGYALINNTTPNSATVNSATVYANTTTAPTLTIANGVTISMWVRVDTIPTTSTPTRILTFFSGTIIQFGLYIRGSNAKTQYASPYYSGGNSFVFGPTAIQSQFAHCVAILTTTTNTLFVNGVKHRITFADQTTTTLQNFYLGCNYNRTEGLNGAISQLMIWNRALSDGECMYLYQIRAFGSYTPLLPKLSNMVCHMTFDNEIQDKTSNYTFAATGTSYNTTTMVYGTGCISFPNATPGGTPTAYLSSTATPTLSLANGVSVSCWVYPTILPAGANTARIFAFMSASELFSVLIDVSTVTPAYGFTFIFNNGTTGLILRSITATINTWVHIVATYNPYTKQIILYTNGVKYVLSASTTNTSLTTLNIGALNSTSRAFAGYVDDFRVFNTPLSDEEVQYLYNVRGFGYRGITYQTEAYFTFDSVVIDYIGNYTMTLTGATYSTTDKMVGTASLVMANTNSATASTATQYVSTSSAPTFSLYEGITIACWLKVNTIPTSGSSVVLTFHNSTTNSILWISASSTNILFNGRNISSSTISVTGPSILTGIWVHITCIYDIGASELRLYVNGLKYATATSFILSSTTLSTLRFGADHALARGFTGQLDNVRIWATTLSDDAIYKYYLSNGAKIQESCGLLGGVVGAFVFDNGITDQTDNFTLTNTGCTFNTTDKIVGNGSLNIANATVGSATNNSATQYVTTSVNCPIYVASGVTIACWVKPTTLAGSLTISSVIVMFDDIANSSGAFRLILALGATPTSYFTFGVQDTSTRTITNNTTTVVNTWYHIVGVVDYANSIINLYVNNEKITRILPPAYFPTILGDMTLGCRFVDKTRAFAGRIDDLKIWNRALDDVECAYLYYGNIHGFGGSGAPEAGINGAITPNTILAYLPFDGDAIDKEGYFTSSTYVGQITYTTFPSEVGYSVNIPNPTAGSASVLATTSITLTATSTSVPSSFTICMWVYFTSTMSTSTRITIFSTSNFSLVHHPTSGIFVEYVGGSTIVTPTFTGSVLSNNTWYHVGIVATPTAMTLFLNGNQVSTVNGTFTAISFSPFYFGRDTSNYRAFQGYLDDFKIISVAMSANNIYRQYARIDGGKYGGGGGSVNKLLPYQAGGNGGHGAVRFTWNTSVNRTFPSTDTTLAFKPTGGRLFTTIGTTYWTVPDNVAYISVVCIGGGAGGHAGTSTTTGGSGGGGALAYKNNILVTPGEILLVTVGHGGSGGLRSVDSLGVSGGISSISRENGTVLCSAGGGSAGTASAGGAGGTVIVGDGGGAGGAGVYAVAAGTSGGGAGGYSGTGGAGTSNTTGNAGTGGGGGSGGKSSNTAGGGGGGVGLYGLGANGAGTAGGGGGGSGGTDGTTYVGASTGGNGGLYGGGGGSSDDTGTTTSTGGDGGQGAVRIIWSDGRSFPSTLVSADIIQI